MTLRDSDAVTGSHNISTAMCWQQEIASAIVLLSNSEHSCRNSTGTNIYTQGHIWAHMCEPITEWLRAKALESDGPEWESWIFCLLALQLWTLA